MSVAQNAVKNPGKLCEGCTTPVTYFRVNGQFLAGTFHDWPIKIESQRKCYTPDLELRENMSQGNCHLFYGRDYNNAAHWPKDKLASGIVKEERKKHILIFLMGSWIYVNIVT